MTYSPSRMTRLLYLSCVLLCVGVCFLAIQSLFFGYVDEHGVLHDSLFLPLGVFACLASCVLFFIYGCLHAFFAWRKKSS